MRPGHVWKQKAEQLRNSWCFLRQEVRGFGGGIPEHLTV